MEKTETLFKELSPQEQLSVNGGGPADSLLRALGSKLGPIAAALTIAVYVYDNWDEFVDGVKEGYESTRNK